MARFVSGVALAFKYCSLRLVRVVAKVPVDASNNRYTEWSETTIFNFPPFANASQPDLATATDRPLYAAANMFRGSGGNPQCGSVAAIFSRAYVSDDKLLASPLDTGMVAGFCDNFGNASDVLVGTIGNTSCLVCGAWPGGARTLGSPPYVQHLLEPYLRFYNATQNLAGPNYPYVHAPPVVEETHDREHIQGPAGFEGRVVSIRESSTRACL